MCSTCNVMGILTAECKMACNMEMGVAHPKLEKKLYLAAGQFNMHVLAELSCAAVMERRSHNVSTSSSQVSATKIVLCSGQGACLVSAQKRSVNFFARLPSVLAGLEMISYRVNRKASVLMWRSRHSCIQFASRPTPKPQPSEENKLMTILGIGDWMESQTSARSRAQLDLACLK